MGFAIKQDTFEGPLELLLDLIEKEKLSISNISLSNVADDYIAYVKSLQVIDPEALAEFLVVAAQLMLIKSKSLLPSLTLSQEDEKSIGDLEKRLVILQKMREFARMLKVRGGEGHYIFSREAYQGFEPVFAPPPGASLHTLSEAFNSLLSALPKAIVLAEEKIKKIISLEEKIAHIRLFLSGAMEKAFSDIARGATDKVEVIISFLAVLELAKQKFLNVEQEELFSEIHLRKL